MIDRERVLRTFLDYVRIDSETHHERTMTERLAADLRALGLEVPEPVALLYELRQAGVDVPLTALTVDECAQVLKELLA